MRAKKVLIVDSGSRFGGGVKTYYANLFSGYNHARLSLIYISLGKWASTEEICQQGETVIVLPENRFRLRTVLDIFKYIKTNGIELVVSQGTISNAYARAASLLSGVPSLVTVHSDIYYDYPNPVLRSLYLIIDRFMRFQTKHYIAVSKYLKKIMTESGIPADRITVVYNGVANISKLETQNSKLNKSQLVIGSIGRLHKVKNYAELIRACASLKIVNWKLEIAGEGEERKPLEQLISNLGLTDRVKLLGNVEDVQTAIEGWDIYVQPSLSEGFGLTVVESMLAGKPVIVSPNGSLPELVDDGKTGMVMSGVSANEIASSINALISDPEKAKIIAKTGQEYAKKTFSIEKFIAETEKAYLEAVK